MHIHAISQNIPAKRYNFSLDGKNYNDFQPSNQGIHSSMKFDKTSIDPHLAKTLLKYWRCKTELVPIDVKTLISWRCLCDVKTLWAFYPCARKFLTLKFSGQGLWVDKVPSISRNICGISFFEVKTYLGTFFSISRKAQNIGLGCFTTIDTQTAII